VRPLVLLLAALLVAGCTTTVAGTPSPSRGLGLPPRPREVRLDGIDPCSLLTPEQRAALNLDGTPRFSRSHVELFRGDVPSCTITSFTLDPPPTTVSISVVTTVGIERWSDRSLAADVRPTSVAGFPAVLAIPTRFTDFCSIEVDVADGQLLDIQFAAGGPQPIPQHELCRRGHGAAVLVMSTLLAR
jgi:hypothetical protein